MPPKEVPRAAPVVHHSDSTIPEDEISERHSSSSHPVVSPPKASPVVADVATPRRKRRVMDKFIRAAQLRQDWGEDQNWEGADWWELLFDLILVAIVFQLAGFLKENLHDAAGIAEAALYTVIFSFTWGDQVMFFTRFRTFGDVYTDMALFMFSITLLAMGVFAGEGLKAGAHAEFSVSVALNRLALAAMYAPIAWYGPIKRPQGKTLL